MSVSDSDRNGAAVVQRTAQRTPHSGAGNGRLDISGWEGVDDPSVDLEELFGRVLERSYGMPPTHPYLDAMALAAGPHLGLLADADGFVGVERIGEMAVVA